MKIELHLSAKEEVVEIHFDHRVSSQAYRFFCSPEEESKSDTDDDVSEVFVPFGFDTPPWVRQLFLIPGVTAVAVYQYEIDLHKARLFSWEPILAAALSILPYALNPEAVVTLSLSEESGALQKVLKNFWESVGIAPKRRLASRKSRKIAAKKSARRKVRSSKKKERRSKRA